MLELLPQIILTISGAAVSILAIALVRRRLSPHYAGFRNRFLLLSLVIIAAKTGYVFLFVLARPEQVYSPDSYRYFAEIQQIALAPWEWNPILGTGPGYDATPKMGMSYLYGLILFFHGVRASTYAILLINVVISFLTCAVVFLLTLRISSAAMPAFLAMFLTAFYPETLFWNARVLRENLTLLLVTVIVYAAVRLFESRHPRHVAYLLALGGLLLITRAQLALLLPLIAIYYAAVLFVRSRRITSVKALPSLALLGSFVFAGFGFIAQQIRAAGGRRMFRLTETGRPLSDRFTDNIGAVLSLTARQEYGSLGVLLMPFTLIVFVLLVMTLLRFKHIFGERSASAGLMVFLIVMFIVGLAVMGLPNIRFRSTVAPLELSLVSAACYYYWCVLKLPRLVLLPIRRTHLARARAGSNDPVEVERTDAHEWSA